MGARIRILSVDDHTIFRKGIAAVIETQPDMELIASAGTGREGIERFLQYTPDVTLMDLRLPDLSGMDAMAAIRKHTPGARIVVLSTSEGDAEIRRALQAGAWGYLLKSMLPQQIVDCIRKVHQGKRHVTPAVAALLAEHVADELLTDREIEVLQHVAGGNRNRDIGEILHITEETVKAHIKHIMEKLGASDRTQAIAIAARRGIIQL